MSDSALHVSVSCCPDDECPLLTSPHAHRQHFLTFFIFQTKDKMCDITDTTHLYPFTTTIVAKTTSRSKEATAGRDTPSTSDPPTSVPTEGKVDNRAGTRPRCILCRSPELSFKQWWMLGSGRMLNEVHLLELFVIGIDAFPLLQHAQDTSLFWRRHKYVLSLST